MRIILFAILFLFISHLSFSQDSIFVLHPFVGDTIDKFEKTKFLLFPEINDSSFCYGQIHYSDKKYLLYSYSENNTTPKIDEIDSLTIKEYNRNIQKLLDYYTALIKTDTIHKPFNANMQNDLNVNLNICPELRKKLTNEMFRYQFLKWHAEQRGLQGKEQENYIKTSGFLTIPVKQK